jgi:hypothetical protein
MIEQETGKLKSGLFSKLPKLSKTSQIVIFIGIFLLIAVPLVLINNQQNTLQNQIIKDMSALQGILSTPLIQKDSIEADIKKTQAERSNLISKFAVEGASNRVAEKIMALAKDYDINIVKLQMSVSKVTMVSTQNASQKADYPTLSVFIAMNGQLAQFTNFLIALDTIPSTRISELDVRLAQNKGEYDSANVRMDIVIYK